MRTLLTLLLSQIVVHRRSVATCQTLSMVESGITPKSHNCGEVYNRITEDNSHKSLPCVVETLSVTLIRTTRLSLFVFTHKAHPSNPPLARNNNSHLSKSCTNH